MQWSKLKKYFKKIWQTKRWLIFVLIFTIFITIPIKHIYHFPDLPNKPVNFKPINIPIPTPFPYPINTEGIKPPQLSALAITIVDVPSNTVIYTKNPNLKLLPASTTKMVTALVASEQYNVNKIASISAIMPIGQIMDLQLGEHISIDNLIKGMLIHSANDAAFALADYYPQGRDKFIELMNQKVKQLGLTDTHFTNPAGLDNPNHYSTVHDLSLIASEFIKNSYLRDIVATKATNVSDVDGTINHYLESTNQLLGNVKGVKGIKTGWTEAAGECLITLVERQNHPVIIAILGSNNRFEETKQLIDWLYKTHQWQDINLD